MRLPYVESVRRIPVLLLALAAAGCGAGTSQTTAPPTSASPQQLIAGAADATASAGSARMALDMTMHFGTQGTMRLSGTGMMDMRSKRGSIDALVDVGARKVRFREVVDGTVVYMKLPHPMPTGQHWLKFDLAKMHQSGVDYGSLLQANQSDPTQMLEYLRGASSSIVRVGEEAVRGTPTTHYHVVLEYDRIAANAPADVRDAVRRSIQQLEQVSGIRSVPADVWVDDQGRVRRETIEMHFENTLLAGMSMRMSFELYDFGVEVDAAPPADSDTVASDGSTMTVS